MPVVARPLLRIALEGLVGDAGVAVARLHELAADLHSTRSRHADLAVHRLPLGLDGVLAGRVDEGDGELELDALAGGEHDGPGVLGEGASGRGGEGLCLRMHRLQLHALAQLPVAQLRPLPADDHLDGGGVDGVDVVRRHLDSNRHHAVLCPLGSASESLALLDDLCELDARRGPVSVEHPCVALAAGQKPIGRPLGVADEGLVGVLVVLGGAHIDHPLCRGRGGCLRGTTTQPLHGAGHG
mmetsp:Transcript_32342/g.75583  ORF Transcript_32342/g.75583 Transcript_32342/m.75583 type:complete len:241 (-) Transcript_32342:106-828(-)